MSVISSATCSCCFFPGGTTSAGKAGNNALLGSAVALSRCLTCGDGDGEGDLVGAGDGLGDLVGAAVVAGGCSTTAAWPAAGKKPALPGGSIGLRRLCSPRSRNTGLLVAAWPCRGGLIGAAGGGEPTRKVCSLCVARREDWKAWFPSLACSVPRGSGGALPPVWL